MRTLALICYVLAFAPAIAFAAAESAMDEDASETALDSLLTTMKTLRADVDQFIIEADGGVLEESSILMLLKKPDGFLWQTLEPFPETLVTNGEWLWNYQPDLEQVVIEPWRRDESEFAAQLLSGDSVRASGDNGETRGLAEEYRISAVVDAATGIAEFTLTPRESSNVNRRITLSFSAATLDSIVLEARSGQRTLWRFENVVVNEAIDAAQFDFVPPAGVEVIRNNYAAP
jgi:outer membrane lipoprotein carrier protein